MSSSRRRPEQQLSISQGRDAREIQLPPSAGKCFLLTSPFIERMRHIILRSLGPPCRHECPLRNAAGWWRRLRLSRVATVGGFSNRGLLPGGRTQRHQTANQPYGSHSDRSGFPFREAWSENSRITGRLCV